MSNILIAGAALIAAAMTSAAEASLIFVRDALGGEQANGDPGGPLLTGTGSIIIGDIGNDDMYDPLFVGTYALEADYGFGFEPLITYCAEAGQDLLFGDNPPDSTGVAYQSDALTNGHGLTSVEADYVQVLWSNAFAQSQTSAMFAAAFQSVVWELTQDDTFDFSIGNFRLSPFDTYTASVQSTAQSWMDNITNETWTSSTPLMILTHEGSQDFFTPVIPAPAASAVLLGGLWSLQRRRRQHNLN